MAMNAAAGRAGHNFSGALAGSIETRGNDGEEIVMTSDGKSVPTSEVFQRVRARLRTAVGEDVFNSWFARLELEEIVDEVAHLSVPTRFLCSWVQSNYGEKIFSMPFASNCPIWAACTSRCG